MLQIQRILVPIDFSEHSTRALAHAREIAASHGARLDLLHVIEEPVFPSFNTLGAAVYGKPVGLRQMVQAALEELVEERGEPDVEAGFGYHVPRGRVAEEIAQFAKEHDIDLIVMASHGLTGLQQLMLGSIAERVVRAASCPVLVVKAFGKSLVEPHDTTAGGST